MLKVLVIFAVVFAITIEGYHKPKVQCPCGWVSLLRSCYLLVKNKVTWDQARFDCLQRGGDLVIPRSHRECHVLSQYVAGNGSVSAPWIGVFRRRSDKQFYNTCGMPSNFTRWAKNEPNDFNTENCVQMYSHGEQNSRWNDISCDAKLGYICQYQVPRCD